MDENCKNISELISRDVLLNSRLKQRDNYC